MRYCLTNGFGVMAALTLAAPGVVTQNFVGSRRRRPAPAGTRHPVTCHQHASDAVHRQTRPGIAAEHTNFRLTTLELGLYPIHVRAQLLALALDLMASLLGAHALEVLLAGAVLGDPLARERAGLDLAE